MKNDLCRDILFVDDDPDDFILIREAINDLSGAFEIKEAHHGEEALHYLDSSHNSLPCLIVMDVNMPVLDGRQTLRIIKEDPRFSKIPIVVFTTSDSKEDRTFFQRYGVEMVTKPASFLRFKEVVKKLVEGHCLENNNTPHN